MRLRSGSSKADRSPMKRRRTPWPCSSSTSLSSARRNRPIRALTSSCGRCQFSLEKANRVNTRTPSRRQASTTSRTALRPALWPKLRGRCRALAQRPLPSMTMAMWRGTRGVLALPVMRLDFRGPAPRAGACSGAKGRQQHRADSPRWLAWRDGRHWLLTAPSSKGHQLLFLGLDHRIDVLDGPVGELLDFIVEAAIVVLGDQLFLEQVLHLLQGVAAHVANGDLRVLALMADELGQFLAALLGERRHVEPDHGAGGGRRDADVGSHQGLLDRRHHGLFPWRDVDRAGVRQCHRGTGAAGTDAREVVLERVDALAHAGLGIVLDVVEHVSFSGESGNVQL